MRPRPMGESVDDLKVMDLADFDILRIWVISGDGRNSRIGVLIGKYWACFKFVTDWRTKGRETGERRIAWAETVAIRLGLLVLSCNIKQKRVSSKDNKADDLSRGKLNDLLWYNEVLIIVPEDLRPLLSQITPDQHNFQDGKTQPSPNGF